MNSRAYHPVVAQITSLLDERGVVYTTFEHEAVRTSEEAAAVRPEYSLSAGAKALIVRIKKKGVARDREKQFVQVVVPGDKKFDPQKLRRSANAKDVRFATPAEVSQITGGVEPGGVPPLGTLFGIPVFADAGIVKNEEIIFNAGDRRFSVALKSSDYLRVVSPTVCDLAA